jgi:hypothetical protein
MAGVRDHRLAKEGGEHARLASTPIVSSASRAEFWSCSRTPSTGTRPCSVRSLLDRVRMYESRKQLYRRVNKSEAEIALVRQSAKCGDSRTACCSGIRGRG